MRRTDQLAGRIVGPAMNRAHDIALQRTRTLQHDRLTMTADVRHLPMTGIRPFIAAVEQHLAVIFPLQRTIITRFRRHQLMPDIARPGIEDELFLQLKNLFVEIPVHRQLGNCWGQTGQSRHVRHYVPPAGKNKHFTLLPI